MAEEHGEAPKKRPSTIWLVTAGIICCALLGVAIWLAVAIQRTVSAPISPAIRNAAHFPLYYPDKLADGYTLRTQRTNYDRQKDVLIMEYGANDHVMTFTQQAAPASLTFDKLKGRGTVIEDVHGQAAISNIEGRKVVSMLSSDRKTLIIVNSQNASDEELTRFTQSLVPLR